MAKMYKRLGCNFTQISNTIILDKNISARAKGVYLYLVSRPDGWSFKVSNIVSMFKEGRDSIRVAIKELEESGYISKKPSRSDETNKFDGWDWLIYSEPDRDTETPNPRTTENQQDGNPILRETSKRISNTELSNTELSNTDNNKKTKAKKEAATKVANVCEEVIAHLNSIGNTSFKASTQSFVKNMKAILKAHPDISIEDINTVVDYKHNEWKGTPLYKHFVPGTLFRLSNFEKYIEQVQRAISVKTEKEVEDEEMFRQFEAKQGWG